mmetsp:Transcript_43057/g.77217  ORF Transcript_43057/g.77217 Transcript_43057/m.77217 type:complete len:341 (-) Transcript_43057:346-1368(-)
MALVERVPAMLPKESQSISCPSCRGRIRVPEITYVNVAKPFPETSGDSAQGAGGSEGPGLGSGLQHPWNDSEVLPMGSYGTKLEAVVRRVLAILKKDPDAKILLFSSWADVLNLLLHALEANKIPTAYAHGGRSLQAEIARFRGRGRNAQSAGSVGYREHSSVGTHPHSDPASITHKGQIHHQAADDASNADVGGGAVWTGRRGRGASRASILRAQAAPAASVLMLLTQQGANGLNLTEAQHVLLVEPLLDPAVEAQAIGRVHRIGQVHETWVHRFITTATVEENVARLGAERAQELPEPSAIAVGSKSREATRLTVRDMAVLLDNHWDVNDRGVGTTPT